MKRTSTFSVTIPQPCNEHWSEMTPTEQGRFCQSCQHQVIDFTKLTDAQIVAYLSKQQGRVCGRMQNFQLNRNLQPPQIESKSLLQKIIAFVAFMMSFGTIKAQETTSAEPIVETVLSDSIPPLQKSDSIQTKQITIRGRIVDKSDMEPIFGCRVMLFGHEEKVLSDFDGKFEITVSREINDTSQLVLLIRNIGQETRVVVVNPDEYIEIELEVEIYETITVGMIVRRPIQYEFGFGTTIRFDRFGRRVD
jgi:hypothetical protein